jgi:hypothetical protein
MKYKFLIHDVFFYIRSFHDCFYILKGRQMGTIIMCHKIQTRINLVFEIILKDENQNIFSTYLVQLYNIHIDKKKSPLIIFLKVYFYLQN